MFVRIRIVMLCQEGLSSREVSRHLRVNQSDVVHTRRRYGDTGTVDDVRRSGCPKATTTVDDCYLWISARGNPESNATMLNNVFVLSQDIVFRLRLYKIGCMMCNFTPDVHGEVHIWHLDTTQCGTDGPNNMLNGLIRIGIKFYSQMSVANAFNQTIVGDVFGGSLVRLNVLDILSSKCSKVVVPWCFGVALCGGRCMPLVVMEGAETAVRYRNDILWSIVQPLLAEFRRGIRLNGQQFSSSSCTSCEWIPSW